MPPHVLRCTGHYKSSGERCRRVAVDGSVVCDQHGGAAPQVIRRAAERLQLTADDAARALVEWMQDPAVEMRERVKIAQDLMDRAGLAAAQVHKVLPITEDPIDRLFSDLLGDPDGLIETETDIELPALPPARRLDDDHQHIGYTESRTAELEDGPSPVHVVTRLPRHIRDSLSELL